MNYYQEEPCNVQNMKFETLVVVAEFEDDYTLSKEDVNQIVRIMYEIIDTYPIHSWNEFATYLDRTLETVRPEIFDYCV